MAAAAIKHTGVKTTSNPLVVKEQMTRTHLALYTLSHGVMHFTSLIRSSLTFHTCIDQIAMIAMSELDGLALTLKMATKNLIVWTDLRACVNLEAARRLNDAKELISSMIETADKAMDVAIAAKTPIQSREALYDLTQVFILEAWAVKNGMTLISQGESP